MAQLPRYEQQKVLQAVDYPTVPANLDTTGQSIQAIGKTIADETAKWAQSINQAETAASLASAVGKASLAFDDLRNSMLQSPDFNVDPASSRQMWEEKAKEIRNNVVSEISNGQAKQLFNARFDALYATHTATIAGDIRKKRVEMVKGAGLQALEDFSRSGASAPDEDTFRVIEGNALATLKGMVAAGALGYDDGQKIWQHWKNTTGSGRAHMELIVNPEKVISDLTTGSKVYSDMDPVTKAGVMKSATVQVDHLNNQAKAFLNEQEKRRVDLTNTAASNYLKNQFNLNSTDPNKPPDFVNAFRLLNSQEFAQAMKLTGRSGEGGEPQVEAVRRDLSAMQSQYDKAAKDRQDLTNRNFEKGAMDLKIPVTQYRDYTDPGTGIRPDEQTIQRVMEWQTNPVGMKHTDPQLFNSLLTQVTGSGSPGSTPSLTDKSKIYSYVGKGLTYQHANELADIMDKRSDAFKNHWVDLVYRDYDARYANSDGTMSLSAAQAKLGFVLQLNRAIREGQVKDDQILAYAQKMYEAVDRQIMNQGFWKRPWGELKGTHEIDYVTEAGGWPTPQMNNPPSSTQPTPAQQSKTAEIPEDVREHLRGVLRDNGQVVSDRNVEHIHRQLVERVNSLRGTRPDEQLGRELSEKGINPVHFGLPAPKDGSSKKSSIFKP